MSEWIKTEEQLPRENQIVLTCSIRKWISVEIYSKGSKGTWDSGYYKYWMELPELPQEFKEQKNERS